ncbi:MAG: 30S ribosomal protein S17 [Candidatus Vogelbacteria bacterium]|nr:30S ribosomal protein S17 [Candidatus Vogelbacteria bacterium]
MTKTKSETTKKNLKILDGVVVSDKMQKTAVVLVKRYIKHPKYQKFITLTKKYKAHDEINTAKVGDKVTIESCRPLSKDKSFMIVEVNGKRIK